MVFKHNLVGHKPFAQFPSSFDFALSRNKQLLNLFPFSVFEGLFGVRKDS
jgi:hypothetical protein